MKTTANKPNSFAIREKKTKKILGRYRMLSFARKEMERITKKYFYLKEDLEVIQLKKTFLNYLKPLVFPNVVIT